MVTLVSPGVSVSVTNDSFFFPATAPTVPVFFIATQSGKLQTDGVTPATGTLEFGVVRTVTSIAQSLQLYGVPSFRNDAQGNEFHGDARNEYGLLALNQFLGAASVAYVVRANIDTTDKPQIFTSFGVPAVGAVQYSGIGSGSVQSVIATDRTVKPQTITVTFLSGTSYSVTGDVSGFIGIGLVTAPFTSTKVNFSILVGAVPFVTGDQFIFSLAYVAGHGVNTGTGTIKSIGPDAVVVPEVVTVTMTSGTTFSVQGSVSGTSTPGVVNVQYDNTRLNFMVATGSTAFAVGDTFTINITTETISAPLGATDAVKRLAIVQALQATINSNVDLRSELYEFNLIACPGYPECVTSLVALSSDVLQEAIVIADTPMNKTPDQVAQWALTSARTVSVNVAYYYPWCLTSNLDGRNVLGAPSGTALRTIAVSDQQAYVWTAPAGVSRGEVTGVSKVGYVTGTLGTATTFVEMNLNQGQRDSLYQYSTNINPIVYFPGRGILIWGQKTSAPAASALDRINVSRLVAYLRRTLRKGAMPFVFEPNDQITRDNLKAAADGMLNDVMSKRGLYDFATLCDKTNNTATRIDRNELWLDIGIKATRDVEFIYIPIRVLSTSAHL